MREGNLIGVDTNKAGALKENDIASTRELYRCHLFVLTNILEKASIVSTDNFESLLRYLGQLDKNTLNVTAGK